MVKHQRISAVVFALMLSLMASPQAHAKQTTEGAFVLDTTGSEGELLALCEAPKQRSAALEQQSNERKELNTRLADLVAKRDAYIVAQQGKQRPRTSSFDQAIAATSKAQIK
jgi:hypothetical protein